MLAEISHFYIHYPFCARLCVYCNFLAGVSPKEEFLENYFQALCSEIQHYQSLFKCQSHFIQSLYLGGGTPSLMPEKHLEQIFKMISPLQKAEITLEINPESVTQNKAKFWKSLGINRVSLGWQSMYDPTLQFLGREHSSQQNIEAFEILRNTGFDNISVDRILSIDKDQNDKFFKILESHLPDHISTYHLTIEEKTILHHWTKEKKYQAVAEEQMLEIEKETDKILSKKGFIRYEISNYAQKEKYSRHNTAYWDHKYWIGVGASAASFLPNSAYGEHRINTRSFFEYCKNPLNSYQTEALSIESAIKERIMLGIRKRSGIKKNDFERDFHIKWSDLFKQALPDYFLEDDDTFLLKKEFIPIANEIILLLWQNLSLKN